MLLGKDRKLLVYNKINIIININNKMNKTSPGTWDLRIKEYEVDPSWKDHPIYKNKSYIDYRKKFEDSKKGNYLSDFPLTISISTTFFKNSRTHRTL